MKGRIVKADCSAVSLVLLLGSLVHLLYRPRKTLSVK
jgi:hypothetical protein